MRMMIRFRREERGAVLAMVAVSMLMLLTLLALTVDLGKVIAIRRAMVAAADSAALAAAEQCGLGHEPSVAETAAGETARMNDVNATQVLFEPGPECGHLTSTGLKEVTVGYDTKVDFVVAPFIGINDMTVTTFATAQWGPTVGVGSPAPLRIDAASMNACMGAGVYDEKADPKPPWDPRCAFGFDNTSANSQSSSQWGFLNLPEGWPPENSANPPTDCGSSSGGSGELANYLNGAGPAFNAVVWHVPVWVCAAGGDMTDVLSALQGKVGSHLVFPVMGPSTTPACLATDVPPCTTITTPGHEAYPIVGFTQVILLGVWKGKKDVKLHCPNFPVRNSSVFCIQTGWLGGGITAGIPGAGPQFDPTLVSVRLIK